jgi:AraC family transcriptional regulator, regulatory protein of adaptative response / methylated-DNA-[protein]-cysteine methyltransferase
MKQIPLMPDEATLYEALVARDETFEGLFVAGVKTTGIFCRPTCPARKPRRENVEFFPRAGDALAAGYRPCRRCQPMDAAGSTPAWLKPLLAAVEADPRRRWTSGEVLALGLEPARVRRWFQAHHGMTFLAYLRSRRLGEAFSRLQAGAGVLEASLEADFDSVSGFCEALRQRTGAPPSAARGQRALRVTQVASPLGPLLLVGDEEAVHLVEFWDRRMLETQFAVLEQRLGAVFFPGTTAPLERMRTELAAYFAGRLRDFTVPLEIPGSAHQQAAWAALRDVPYGETRTYGQLAARLGRPSAARAVARAVGENRFAIVIPCHRIVGADGQLTGYGGGLWRKRHLLALERGNRSSGGSSPDAAFAESRAPG